MGRHEPSGGHRGTARLGLWLALVLGPSAAQASPAFREARLTDGRTWVGRLEETTEDGVVLVTHEGQRFVPYAELLDLRPTTARAVALRAVPEPVEAVEAPASAAPASEASPNPASPDPEPKPTPVPPAPTVEPAPSRRPPHRWQPLGHVGLSYVDAPGLGVGGGLVLASTFRLASWAALRLTSQLDVVHPGDQCAVPVSWQVVAPTAPPPTRAATRTCTNAWNTGLVVGPEARIDLGRLLEATASVSVGALVSSQRHALPTELLTSSSARARSTALGPAIELSVSVRRAPFFVEFGHRTAWLPGADVSHTTPRGVVRRSPVVLSSLRLSAGVVLRRAAPSSTPHPSR